MGPLDSEPKKIQIYFLSHLSTIIFTQLQGVKYTYAQQWLYVRGDIFGKAQSRIGV